MFCFFTSQLQLQVACFSLLSYHSSPHTDIHIDHGLRLSLKQLGKEARMSRYRVLVLALLVVFLLNGKFGDVMCACFDSSCGWGCFQQASVPVAEIEAASFPWSCGSLSGVCRKVCLPSELFFGPLGCGKGFLWVLLVRCDKRNTVQMHLWEFSEYIVLLFPGAACLISCKTELRAGVPSQSWNMPRRHERTSGFAPDDKHDGWSSC